jgi:hypothetical protein
MEVLVQEICESSKQQHQKSSRNPLRKHKPRFVYDPSPQNPRNLKKGQKNRVKQELVLTPGLLADVGVEAGTHGEREEGFGPRTRLLLRRRRRRGRGARENAVVVGFWGGERGGRGIFYYKSREGGSLDGAGCEMDGLDLLSRGTLSFFLTKKNEGPWRRALSWRKGR